MKPITLALLALSAFAQDDQTPPARQVIIPAGTWVKARVDDRISSDTHRTGDIFNATLAQPIIVDGLVVARRGQTMEGRVTESVRAGRVRGESRLGVEMVEMALADGRQMPVRTQLIESTAGGGEGRDAAGAGATIGTGAAIGGAVGGGKGAAIGAGAGAAAAIIGVLATRGPATTIHAESVLTFRTLSPITVDLSRGAVAFEPVRQEDYEPRTVERRERRRDRGPVWGTWGYPTPGWGWGGGPGLIVVGGGRRGWGRRW
ncbi:MAG: hypothetical protein FJW30_02865 [Acidobacteria bacterium]|nr:hypothetical protein [Acidobacteriota bacterium]